MRIRLFAAALAVSTVTAAASRADAQVLPAEDHVVELGLVFWQPTPEITLSTDALADSNVDEVDFVEEFGIEEKRFREFRLTAGRSHKFRLSYVRFEYDEEATIRRTIVFQGRTFNIGVPAAADVQWDLWRFGYEWDFVRASRGFFGMFVDLKYNKVQASIDSPALTSAAATDTRAPVPTFGVVGRAYPAEMVSIGGEFTGFSLDSDEFEGEFYDFDINGIVSFGRNVGAQVGYRSISVDYLVDEDFGEIRMKGPYFGGVLRF